MSPELRGLRYVSDRSPGITRIRKKTRSAKPVFIYRSAAGRIIRDRTTLARIRALAIPPAYEDVWVSTHPNGHLQATGRDARGRKQYRYHARWRLNKDELKHGKMHEFARALPRLRRILRKDLGTPGLPQEKVLALVLTLLDATAVRVGNAEYARSNGSFGLSTLRDRHVRFAANGAGRLYFPGKGGKVHDVPIDDPKLSTLVRKCQQLPGQQLFQYVDENGRRRGIDSAQVNQYLQRHLGPGFSAKDFRTWHATLRAYELLLALKRPDPPSDRALRAVLKQVIGNVATELRNTPAVCRKSYINPLVLTAWQEARGPFDPRRTRRGGSESLLRLLRNSG